MARENVKVEMLKMLDALPDDLTWEDLQYHIYVRQKVERAMADVEAGRTLSQEKVEEAMREHIKKWR